MWMGAGVSGVQYFSELVRCLEIGNGVIEIINQVSLA
jgi:hypothetical protein